jgi:hypothetical protein
MGKLD